MPFAELLAAQDAWRANGNDTAWERLVVALYDAVGALRRCGYWKWRLRNQEFHYRVHHRDGTEWVVSAGVVAVPFDDVRSAYIVRTLGRYRSNLIFTITAPAFLETGCAQEAHTMLRQLRPREVPPEPQPEPQLDDDPLAQEARDTVRRRALWFHRPRQPYQTEARGRRPLSLRMCYVSLRVSSGAMLQDVSRELRVNPTQLSKLQHEMKELTGSQPHLVPLAPMAPTAFEPIALVQFGLVDRQGPRWDISREADDDARDAWVLRRKMVLWKLYEKAVAMKDGAPGPSTALEVHYDDVRVVLSVRVQDAYGIRSLTVTAVSGLDG